MTTWRRGFVLLPVLIGACIIPDSLIDVQPNRTNPGTVRIVHAVALSQQVNDACAEEPGFEICPLPSVTLLPGLIQPEEPENQAFCICETGRDGNFLGGFDIFVEDPDVDEDGIPTDSIFGAFLLDAPADAEAVSSYVAYTNYLPTNQPARPIAAGTYEQPIERPATNLRSWAIAIDTAMDLCNDNNGEALTPGLHNLRFVATDRPWPQPILLDEAGLPQRDGDDYLRDEAADPLVGVPDLPAGASYDTIDFVFRCVDEADEQGANVCSCEEADG